MIARGQHDPKRYNVARQMTGLRELKKDVIRQLRLAPAGRTLLKRPITPADQAEAVFLLLTDRLKQTTGQIITVDGGLHEAFLR